MRKSKGNKKLKLFLKISIGLVIFQLVFGLVFGVVKNRKLNTSFNFLPTVKAQDIMPESAELGARYIREEVDVQNQPGANTLQKFFIRVIAFFANVYIRLVGAFFEWLAGILVGVAEVNNFNPYAVQEAWRIVRDLINLGFVIMLLVIAFSTILRIQSYHARRTLTPLIIMAFLVNFSKSITLFLIDVVQVIMLTFASAIHDAAAQGIFTAFGFKNMFTIDSDTLIKLYESGGGWTGVILATILAVILITVATVVVFLLVMVLIIRVIALYVLVILSPIAFVGSAIPFLKKYSSQWWSKFGEYLVKGPVLIFFLWLTLFIYATSKTNQFGQPTPLSLYETKIQNVNFTTSEIAKEKEQFQNPSFASEISSAEGFLSFLVAVVLLGITLSMTQQIGGFVGEVAGKATGMLRKIGSAAVVLPLRPAWAGIKRGWEETEKKVPWLNVPKLVKGWIEWGRERGKERKEEAEAKRMELIERIRTGPLAFRKEGFTIPHLRKTQIAQEQKMMKEMGLYNMTRDELVAYAWKAKDLKGDYGRLVRRAIIRVAAEKGHLDDITQFEGADGQFKGKYVREAFLKMFGEEKEMVMRIEDEVNAARGIETPKLPKDFSEAEAPSRTVNTMISRLERETKTGTEAQIDLNLISQKLEEIKNVLENKLGEGRGEALLEDVFKAVKRFNDSVIKYGSEEIPEDEQKRYASQLKYAFKNLLDTIASESSKAASVSKEREEKREGEGSKSTIYIPKEGLHKEARKVDEGFVEDIDKKHKES